MNYTNKDIIIWLNHLNVSNKNIMVLIDRLENIKDILSLDDKFIRENLPISKQAREKILKNRKSPNIERILKKLYDLKVKVLTIIEEAYPTRLINIPDPPAVLYIKGRDLIFSNSIGIVGSRKPTNYGISVCKKFSGELANRGITIVSGLAMGIDSVAHKTALDHGGYTIGVLGTGVDKIYPASNKRLYEEMYEKATVVSEFPLGSPARKYTFPQRNRIISGLSDGIIIVEAKERSGTLVTASHGLDQGKDIFAVPGNINSLYSRGTNKLIKDGASPILEVEDLFEEISRFRYLPKETCNKKIDYSQFSQTELRVLKLLDEPKHIDLIVYELDLDIGRANTLLIGLELKGAISEIGKGIFMTC